MRKTLLLFALVLTGILIINTAEAQSYRMAAGLRLGSPLSASAKFFISEKSALEAYVGTRGYSGYRWTNISGAYLVHNSLDIDGLEGLQWYAGAGLSVYFWSYQDSFIGRNQYSSRSTGIQGYAGLEYTFEDIPLSISADWIPTYFLGSDVYLSSFGYGYGSLGIRYVISR